jgi:ribosomal 50S subunit-recycling heat shock protein
LIKINGRRSKPASNIEKGDIIAISGSRPATIEIKDIPTGNTKKEDRDKFFRLIDQI